MVTLPVRIIKLLGAARSSPRSPHSKHATERLMTARETWWVLLVCTGGVLSIVPPRTPMGTTAEGCNWFESCKLEAWQDEAAPSLCRQAAGAPVCKRVIPPPVFE